MKPILILISLLLNNLIYSNIYCIDHSVNTVINTLTPKKTNLKAYNNTPFRFSGQYEDVETGLYYNRFRYYSPDTGTYISQDPIGLRGNNPNFYAYVSDVNSFIDPLGLMAKGIGVSMNTALTDVPNRGVHVNVVDGKRSMHIEIEGVKNGKNYNLNYKPADPTANDIMQKNSSKWNKITDSVDDFVSNPKNAKKLANIADAAAQNFPKNTKDFKTTATALKTICK
ncbi:RHS repeat-associated core domain-containing protein [Tenacibaculum maritimum]|uniref:RHS repeat-associated core domain-containing protein n=2 Tax=Tenacibaculum maritimum TaxID=107401 RepID=UPI001E303238|nr:RHS repeat-associated core domain-containing protein [Tenacibaculum maritimum]MCD9585877.1 RHS repeat-associated core domain-containing protein [Tenacibaculum maritimum]MCD9622001.1 RHS repeat-associated core domain-containing protein [Tenacibaculum maritimum]MCD9628526.1 RHS repeat-associated core domain-containing protein [Tenacibaculum maritimum]MCD9631459.1 RHS repeat-associated core domain-containing protein [Tenacibaculum maritimum]MCD9634414.1 RHS repeat-associated core domain-contai